MTPWNIPVTPEAHERHHEQRHANGQRLSLLARSVVASSWIWLIVAIPSFTDAACDSFFFLNLGAAGFLIGAAWIVVTAARPSLLRRPKLKWWLSVPCAGLLGVYLAATHDDLALRVFLCESSLRTHVAEVLDGRRHERPMSVGLFTVNFESQWEGAVYLFTSRSFLNTHGVAYVPNGVAAPRTKIHKLYGPWYQFDYRF
jgi:hypothetical protein